MNCFSVDVKRANRLRDQRSSSTLLSPGEGQNRAVFTCPAALCLYHFINIRGSDRVLTVLTSTGGNERPLTAAQPRRLRSRAVLGPEEKTSCCRKCRKLWRC